MDSFEQAKAQSRQDRVYVVCHTKNAAYFDNWTDDEIAVKPIFIHSFITKFQNFGISKSFSWFHLL